MLLRRPTRVDATTTTVTMPITTPRIASAERAGCARTEASARRAASRSAVHDARSPMATRRESRRRYRVAVARRAGYHPAAAPLPAAANNASSSTLRLDGERHRCGGRCRRGCGHRDRGAGQSTEQRQHHRFGQHFLQHLRSRCTERAAQPDLARALRHRHEHGVGDHDDRRQQRHQRDRPGGRADARRQVGDEAARRLRRQHVEVVGAAGAKRARRPQRGAGVVLRGDGAPPVAGFREHLQASRGAERPLERAQRNPHVLVDRAAAGGADAALHADHRESSSGQADRLTDDRRRSQTARQRSRRQSPPPARRAASSSGPKKRPSTRFRSRITASDDVVPVIEAASTRRLPRATSARACALGA